MFRTTDIILVAVMVSAAAFTYTTKHAAEAELSKQRRLETAIRLEQESIELLKADWSLLTQPVRLQRLADIYHEQLQLVPLEPHQIAEFYELPARPLQIEDLLGEMPDAVADGGIDGLVTGGVVQ